MERRTEKIRIRLTKEEWEHLKKCSGSFSIGKFQNGRENFSAYLRDKLLSESNYKNRILEQQMKELRYELRKIGTNVNQIAKKLNSGWGRPDDIAELYNYLKRIESALLEYQKGMEDLWQSQS